EGRRGQPGGEGFFGCFQRTASFPESSINENGTPRKRRLSVSLKRHALGGTHFCAQSRDRNSFPLILLRLAGFRGAQALAKIGALRQRRLAASSTGRASPPLPWGQNRALNRALALTGSHTPSALFPCRCPARTHMSSGQDFFH